MIGLIENFDLCILGKYLNLPNLYLKLSSKSFLYNSLDIKLSSQIEKISYFILLIISFKGSISILS